MNGNVHFTIVRSVHSPYHRSNLLHTYSLLFRTLERCVLDLCTEFCHLDRRKPRHTKHVCLDDEIKEKKNVSLGSGEEDIS